MTKKIILILAIIAPFVGYYLLFIILKLEKKIPIIKLSILSLIFTILVFGYFRYSSHFPPDTTYSPPKLENGKLVPAENK